MTPMGNHGCRELQPSHVPKIPLIFPSMEGKVYNFSLSWVSNSKIAKLEAFGEYKAFIPFCLERVRQQRRQELGFGEEKNTINHFS
jgi:hypothetical protein